MPPLPDPADFHAAPNGGADFAVIPEAVAVETGGALLALPVRLQEGTESGFGAGHAGAERTRRLQLLGFRDLADYVSFVATAFTEIWQARGGRPMLLVTPGWGKSRAGKPVDNVLVIELRSRSGDDAEGPSFYGVTTVIPDAAPSYKANGGRTLIWRRSSAPASPDVGPSAPVGPVSLEVSRGEAGGGSGQTR